MSRATGKKYLRVTPEPCNGQRARNSSKERKCGLIRKCPVDIRYSRSDVNQFGKVCHEVWYLIPDSRQGGRKKEKDKVNQCKRSNPVTKSNPKPYSIPNENSRIKPHLKLFQIEVK
jgi:hypothetical protein